MTRRPQGMQTNARRTYPDEKLRVETTWNVYLSLLRQSPACVHRLTLGTFRFLKPSHADLRSVSGSSDCAYSRDPLLLAEPGQPIVPPSPCPAYLCESYASPLGPFSFFSETANSDGPRRRGREPSLLGLAGVACCSSQPSEPWICDRTDPAPGTWSGSRTRESPG